MASPENGLNGWLRYAALSNELRAGAKRHSNIIILLNRKDETSPIWVAGKELQDGIYSILGQKLEILFGTASGAESSSSIIIGTLTAFAHAGGGVQQIPNLKDDGFWLNSNQEEGSDTPIYIIGQNERGALYGAFEYLMRLAQGDFSRVSYAANPSAPIRWSNHWDNLDGSIERGYAGPSIFFRGGEIVQDLTRVKLLARLMASIRLNGIIINNVNANSNLLRENNLKGLGRVADVMRPYGVRIGVALYFDAPKDLGGLPTSDPLDPDVIAWWNQKTAELYEHVPDLMGYLIKANSEGQPGPLTYNRTLADGANMFARALKPYAFVYNHHLDESNWKNDRANAAVEYIKGLDTEFDNNVVIQIKFGPIDFQVREPPSPLLANLRRTNAVIEFQSHYTILDFDLRVEGKPSIIRDILSGNRFNWTQSGYAAVVNVGSDTTWLGHHLSMSNFYAYGRLAWDSTLDWTRLTFGLDKTIVDTITNISMESWPTYENYTGNLGIQTLCDILYTHYGPSPGSQDGNGWGQWTRADAEGIGMDRTVATGTGNTGQYPAEVGAMFENIHTTPDDLLLWFHHVPYTYRLNSGKTVIQHFYDAHYTGAETAHTFPTQWEALKGLIDDERFEHIAFRLSYQAGHSIVWRDAVNRFYFTKCGIRDEKNRVGNHPWRIRTEAMQLKGYKSVDVTPLETASGGKAVITTSGDTPGTVTMISNYQSGVYNVAVGYYDHLGGRSQYELFVNDKSIGKWSGDLEDKLGHDFSEYLDGHSATRITFPGVQLEMGDVLKIVGQPDGNERAPLDYVAILPDGVVD
ncbi:alpha-glucuronidase [Xylogone sp. PMI_703]|nr:alpha-glucuronidase [Xylogone sp. PMI_703]